MLPNTILPPAKNGLHKNHQEHVIPQAQNQSTGLFDAMALAIALGMQNKEMAQYLGITERSLRRLPSSSNQQPGLKALAATVARIRILMGGSLEDTRIWLRAPNPAFGFETPMDNIIEGHLELVNDLLEVIEKG
jgi:uncharacterized protein (DUF2384 family)